MALRPAARYCSNNPPRRKRKKAMPHKGQRLRLGDKAYRLILSRFKRLVPGLPALEGKAQQPRPCAHNVAFPSSGIINSRD